MNTIIQVKEVSKKYRHIDESYTTLRDTLSNAIKSPLDILKKPRGDNDFWAVKNISFEVEEGEILGIIGPNGAGKSTLLKLLSQITPPTEGEIVLRGRVASLLEVGTGFHPELSGKENIYLNGAILGMSKKEIDAKIEQIIEFSELEKFIYMPVKKYSSGMYVRLAFSVAAHLEPEILLVDEVLAVGDARFQKKSLGKMDEVAKKHKRTMIFISHDLVAVKKLCRRTILVDNGELIMSGPTADVVKAYLQSVEYSSVEENASRSTINRDGSGELRVTRVRIVDAEGKELKNVRSGNNLEIVFDYECKKSIKGLNFSFSIHTDQDQNVILHQSKYSDVTFDINKGKGEVHFLLNRLPLISGNYFLKLRVDKSNHEVDYSRDPLYTLKVKDGDFYGTGVIPLQHSPVLVTGEWKHVKI